MAKGIETGSVDWVVQALAKSGTGPRCEHALPVNADLRVIAVCWQILLEEREERGQGPKVLVMAPTRELAKQVRDGHVSFHRDGRRRQLYPALFDVIP